jgi:hypothetical protein
MVTIGDIIIFKYITGEKSTGSDIFDTLLGEVTASKMLEDGEVYTVSLLDEEQEPTGEKLNVSSKDILCNLFNTPRTGEVYGKQIIKKPGVAQVDNHKVFIHLPDAEVPVATVSEVVDKVSEYWDSLSELFQKTLKDNNFEIHVKEGDVLKSSYSKKSKKSLDGSLILMISFKDLITVKTALSIAFSTLTWVKSSDELKNEWLTFFAKEFSFDKLSSLDFEEKFIKFLLKKKDLQLNPEDQLLCKFLVKEIKKIKCLSFKDLKVLVRFEGEAFVKENVLPEVLNMVKLKGGIRSTPLSNTNAVRSFSKLLSNYVLTSNCSEDYRNTFQSFLEDA